MDRTPTRAQRANEGNGSRQRLSKNALDRFRPALLANGLGAAPIREFPEGTATAADAAAALGVEIGRIVKSLVFMAGDHAVIALTSGPNRVDINKLANLTAQKITRANADQVRQATGFAIGGVPPIGHPRPLRTFIDRDLLRYERVYAAAGTPHTVFAIVPAELARITGGRVTDLAAHPAD
jgi:prolyl-tRNA editing enzyme YbaK/EbsC (Cys-tRNA(Pro) deacylase)